MKKLSYDVKFNRLNYTPDDGDDIIEWDVSGNKFSYIQRLISILEGTSMEIIYSSAPEKHMADTAIGILQTLRGALLAIEEVLLISDGNQDVADLISGAGPTDPIGESGLTKSEYLEVSGAIAALMILSETDITLADARTVKFKEIVMRGYEV